MTLCLILQVGSPIDKKRWGEKSYFVLLLMIVVFRFKHYQYNRSSSLLNLIPVSTKTTSLLTISTRVWPFFVS